jgi:hypothetical protein
MKLVGAISTAVLSLSLGVGVPAYAQQEHHEQQEEKGKPAAGKDKQAQPEHAKQEENSKQEDNAKRQENAQPEKSGRQENARQEKNGKQENKAREQHAQETKSNNQQDHARGNGGGRIPEDRYKANFGRDHRFRVTESNYRDRRFQYGGYSFGFVDAWPGNWLYTQDVYVVEINGVYYLCNASYPGVNLELSFNL